VDFATLPDDEQIMKVMMIDPEPLLSRAIAQLPAELHERYTGAAHPYFLEFMNKRSNKGTGVAALAEHLGWMPPR
jgi:hydroxymethylpyrimidine pyrophosphatase-like HAD family hydrolase